MTHEQYTTLKQRVDYYGQLKCFKEQLSAELCKFKEHGPRGFSIDFVGVSCRIGLCGEVSQALLPQIEHVYQTLIARCVRDMEAIEL